MIRATLTLAIMLSTGIMILAGCVSTPQQGADRKEAELMPKSDAIVTVDLAALSIADVRLGDDFIDTADLAVDQRSADGGTYTHIDLAPRPGMSEWMTVVVDLPQTDFADGIEWIELEAWNPGVPLRVVVDGTDQDAECFEIGFCPNDTVWEGWRRFRVPMFGEGFLTGDTSLDRAVRPPVRIKWLIVIMRQGLPWQLGLRQLLIKPLK